MDILYTWNGTKFVEDKFEKTVNGAADSGQTWVSQYRGAYEDKHWFSGTGGSNKNRYKDDPLDTSTPTTPSSGFSSTQVVKQRGFSPNIGKNAAASDLYLFDWDAGTADWTNSDFVDDDSGITPEAIWEFPNGSTKWYMEPGGDIYSDGIPDPPPAGDPELRHLGLASDATNLYITQNNGGTLQHVYYDLATLTAQGTASLGAATYAQVDSNTYGIYPVVKASDEQKVYLRGRDGNDLQVQHNALDGTLGWVDDGPGTATWGVAKFAVSLSPDPLRSDDITVAFDDDDLYRTEDNATTWTKYGDATTGLRAGLRFATANNEHIVGGTAAGSVFYTPNWGVSFEDTSGTTLGTIEWFEESR